MSVDVIVKVIEEIPFHVFVADAFQLQELLFREATISTGKPRRKQEKSNTYPRIFASVLQNDSGKVFYP